MSLLLTARDLLKRYGVPIKFAAKIALGVIVPGSPPVIDLIEKVFDCAIDTTRDNLHSIAEAKDLERVEAMFGMLQHDFASVLEKIAQHEAQPALAEEIMRQALANQAELRLAAQRLQDLTARFEVMERYQKKILHGVEELQALQPEVLGVCSFLMEWQQSGCTPQEMASSLKDIKQALADLANGRASQAEAELARLALARPQSAAVASALATAQVSSRQFVKAGRTIAHLRELRPDDPDVAALQRRVTIMSGAGDTPIDRPRAPMPIREGDNLDGWTLTHLLGHGGWGQVYLATKNNERAAIKIMHPELSRNPIFVSRFRKEIMAMIRLGKHPNLISILDFGCVNESWYFVMEYIDGISLEKHLETKGPLAPQLARQVYRQVALGLKVAHEKGISHRDIKPANILLRKDNSAVLADFGLAGAIDEAGRTKVTGMTNLFAAPEQLRVGIADHRSDVYSLAASLYYTLMYDQPHKREPHCFDPTSVDHADLCTLLERALQNDPAKRPRDAGEFLAEWDKPLIAVVPQVILVSKKPPPIPGTVVPPPPTFAETADPIVVPQPEPKRSKPGGSSPGLKDSKAGKAANDSKADKAANDSNLILILIIVGVGLSMLFFVCAGILMGIAEAGR